MKWHQCYTYDPSPYCSDPPNKSGIYAIFIYNIAKNKKRLIYIGSSLNLKKRLNRLSHSLISHKIVFPFLIIAFAIECENYLEKEKRYIKRLHPILNKQHNKFSDRINKNGS